MNRTQKKIIGWALVGLGGLMVFGTIVNTRRLEKAFDQLLTNPLLYIGLGLGIAGAVVLVGLTREDRSGEALGMIESKNVDTGGTQPKQAQRSQNSKKSVDWSDAAFIIGAVIVFMGAVLSIIFLKDVRDVPRISTNRPDQGKLSFTEFLYEQYPLDALNLSIDLKKDVPAGFFTIGSSKEKVIEAQGEPSYTRNYVWSYDDCRVFFDKNETVCGYKNLTGKLKVLLIPMKFFNKPVRSFKIGSDQIEVLAVQGTPIEMNSVIWNYVGGWVEFEKGKVKKVVNFNDQLKIAEEK